MHKHVVVGGTFDKLHTGHQHFLTHAFTQGARVTIGLTSARYVRRYKKGKGIAPYSKRYQVLTSWLRREGYAARTTVVPLDDPHGSAVLPDGFDAIVVTEDNYLVAHQINLKREAIGLPALVVIRVALVAAQDRTPISSTRIRRGEIDREGRLLMPDSLKPDLQKSLGTVLTGAQIPQSVLIYRDNVIVTVGDVTTQTVFACGVQPSLAIIDLLVERKPYQPFESYKFPKRYAIRRLTSGPGYISKRAIREIAAWSKSVKKRTVLVIAGEEDLLTIPALIEAPIGAVLYYGQPRVAGKEGMVEVVVTQKKKDAAKELLSQFI